MKNKITTLSYDEIHFQFIISHHDIHLEGTCVYENKLCYFKTIKNCDEDNCDIFVDIFKLNIFEKIKWFFKQLLFELCVGKHYSYQDNKKLKTYFYYRKPEFLFKFLFKLYYKQWKN